MSMRIDPVFKVIAGVYAAAFAAKKVDQYIDKKIDRLNGSRHREPDVSSQPLTDMRTCTKTSSEFARWLMHEFILAAEDGDRCRFDALVQMYARSLTVGGRQTLWNTALISGRELKKGSALAECQHALVLYDVCVEMW